VTAPAVEVAPVVEATEVRVEQAAEVRPVIEKSETQATTILPLSSLSTSYLSRFGSHYGGYPYAGRLGSYPYAGHPSYLPYGWY
jgi:hypothetical protein